MMRRGFGALLGLAAVLATGCTGGGGGGGEGKAVLTLTADSLSLTTNTAQTSFSGSLGLQVANPPAGGLWVGLDYTNSAIAFADFTPEAPDYATLWVYFRPPNTLAPGTYNDTVTVHVCYDDDCDREIGGSPRTIPVTLTVVDGGGGGGDPPPDPEPEPGPDPLPLTNPRHLGHDVIDAEYSTMLDAIVMVSGYPAPALYLHDPATGEEQSIALDKLPTSVSVGPDGLSAAVGHDALITVVDLDRIGDVVVSPKTLLNVSTDVIDIVLADNGYVYAFPRVDQWEQIRTVHIATNTETLSTGMSIRAGTLAKLHPAGAAIYGADNGLSPSDIERYDIRAGNAVVQYDSPYHGDYAMCGNLWIHEEGARIYTACGNAFRASDIREQDMTYAGSLELTEAQYYGSSIKWLSHSVERVEIALLDESVYACDVLEDESCYTYLALYDADYFNLAARYSLAPVAVAEAGGQSYAQRGLFVFHSSDGTRRYLVSRLAGMPNPDYEYLVASVDVTGSPPPGPDPEPPPAPVVNSSTEAGIPAAPLADVAAVPHDVVDAEYSAALNAIVAVSSYPTNALYVHDLATRTERSIALVKAPTAVSVAPDGLRAAVGHDALVTVVDLAPGGADAPVLLDASLKVLDVVMAGNGYVYAFPRVDQWQNIHSIHIASNTETTSNGSIYAGTLARLHPSATKMYGANNGLSPADIERYSITGGTAQIAYDSPYHGDYPMCGNLWFSESGVNIYTACGRTFRSSDVQAQDMVYAGTLPLSASEYRIVSASDSAEAAQVALIEHDAWNCGPHGSASACNSHLNLYGNAFLTLSARYSLSPFTVGENTYPQRGLYVFHTADGTQRYVVSRLYGMPNPYAEFYISRLP